MSADDQQRMLAISCRLERLAGCFACETGIEAAQLPPQGGFKPEAQAASADSYAGAEQ